MGIFGRFFKDPERDLERAEALLGRGEPGRALELVERVVRSGSAAHQERAESLARVARDKVVETDLERAAKAEASEYFEDAAEWVRSALDHTQDGARRAELEERLTSLLERAREADAEEPFDMGVFASDEVAEVAEELSEDDIFYALIGTLKDDVADRYADLPAAFRRALVDLHDGRADSAQAALDELAAAEPDDAVIHLERGRCRLASGDTAGARADLEAAWQSLGDETLDLAEQTSVPGLWAEAMLGEGEAEAVVSRLADLADPSRLRADLASPYAMSLLAANRFEEARDFLVRAVPSFAADQDLPYFLAQALGRLGDRAAAIDCLEGAIAPSCTTGACKKPPLHLPSVRALAALHLESEDGLQRAGDLLTRLAQATGGRLMRDDFLLLARYHEIDGNPDGAADARAEAEQAPATASSNAPAGNHPPAGQATGAVL